MSRKSCARACGYLKCVMTGSRVRCSYTCRRDLRHFGEILRQGTIEILGLFYKPLYKSLSPTFTSLA